MAVGMDGREAPDGIRSTVLPPSPESVASARRFTMRAIDALGGSGANDDVELLVSELTTNAVLHAHTPMRLSVLRHGQHVRVELRDDDPTQPGGNLPPPMALGGRGIPLVKRLAWAWGVNSNTRGKTVWFEV
jgi:anti-sigma regulatory factor (Ser/Thr protein kinase)